MRDVLRKFIPVEEGDEGVAEFARKQAVLFEEEEEEEDEDEE